MPTPKACGLGLSPTIAIGAYATGAGLGTIYCEQDCRSFLPLPPRNDELQNVWGIQMGDALLTSGEQDKRVASPGATSQSSRA
jgi:hypothetical protein